MLLVENTRTYITSQNHKIPPGTPTMLHLENIYEITNWGSGTPTRFLLKYLHLEIRYVSL